MGAAGLFSQLRGSWRIPRYHERIKRDHPIRKRRIDGLGLLVFNRLGPLGFDSSPEIS
jgi:hypothetical protein